MPKHDYFYNNVSEQFSLQFSFLCIPKVLLSNQILSQLSCESKLLYGLLLDRMSLSRSNGWTDEQNRIYLHFTLNEAMSLLRCSSGKAVKTFSELDTKKGVGLIERKKQGLGKPDIIYMKNFLGIKDKSFTNLDYFYKGDDPKFIFYRIPKELFTNEAYISLSCESKLLYGLLLDRMSLSRKNGWVNHLNHVYVYFPISEVESFIGCGTGTAVKVFSELSDIGLVERIKQGLGKPDILYAKTFIPKQDVKPAEEPVFSKELTKDTKYTINKNTKSLNKRPSTLEVSTELQNLELKNSNVSRVAKNESQELSKLESQSSKICNSGVSKFATQEFQNLQASNTNLRYTKTNNTNLSINHRYINTVRVGARANMEEKNTDKIDMVDKYAAYRDLLHEQLDYDVLCESNEKDDVDEIIEIMLEVLTTKKPTIRVCSEDKPTELVKSKFLKMDYGHIDYVIDCMKTNSSEIRNIKAYLLTALYNAPATINSYYSALVRFHNPALTQRLAPSKKKVLA